MRRPERAMSLSKGNSTEDQKRTAQQVHLSRNWRPLKSKFAQSPQVLYRCRQSELIACATHAS